MSQGNIIKKCAYCRNIGMCFACAFDETQISYFYEESGELAPRPDGKCYCGSPRTICPAYKKFGTDHQGFK